MVSSSQATTASESSSNTDGLDASLPSPPGPALTPSSCSTTARDLPATATWIHAGQSRSLSDLRFDFIYDTLSHDAFFKLRLKVAMLKSKTKPKPRGKPNKGTKGNQSTTLFILVPPERIQRLTLGDHEKQFGVDTVCLRFDLINPAKIVGPKQQPEKEQVLDACGKEGSDVLDALQSLAQATSLAVYTTLSSRTLASSRLQMLCADATEGRLKSDAGQANLSSLYGGTGGDVMCTSAPADDNPPSYHEAGPGPPMPPSICAGSHKRQRGISDTGSVEMMQEIKQMREWKSEWRAELRTEMDQMRAEIKSEVRAEVEAEITTKFEVKWKKVREDLKSIRDKLDELDHDHEELTKQLGDVIDEVDIKVENAVDVGMQSVRDTLRDATLSIDF
ncbi:uncharacterized protein BCR38DRAFT_50567 [Pseudomassariella vexata]|uniref:Uncharacterized protein n=1 Tax=Pseudomassariella vexata TaxID=1141098 RepID=A0A1Y2DPD7_9PEZI|nr:uncharacterized protein BCR38DRAFT_50567 [Pseudomassariella vexata]ORY61014.1 hypothetical protein BCR38DRAFT_50567 [Pseudomassariella vexata]